MSQSQKNIAAYLNTQLLCVSQQCQPLPVKVLETVMICNESTAILNVTSRGRYLNL